MMLLFYYLTELEKSFLNKFWIFSLSYKLLTSTITRGLFFHNIHTSTEVQYVNTFAVYDPDESWFDWQVCPSLTLLFWNKLIWAFSTRLLSVFWVQLSLVGCFRGADRTSPPSPLWFHGRFQAFWAAARRLMTLACWCTRRPHRSPAHFHTWLTLSPSLGSRIGHS